MRSILLKAAWIVVAAILLSVTIAASGPAAAHAEEARTVYWHVQIGEGIDDDTAEDFTKALRARVQQAEEKHVVHPKELEHLLRNQTMQVPPCFEGATPCGSHGAVLVQVLHVYGVVETSLHKVEGGWSLDLTFHRDFGGAPREVSATGTELDTLIADAVGQLFTLEALFTFTSSPPGAMIYVNGILGGETPIKMQLAEGTHSLRVEAEGYQVFREELAVTAGEVRTHKAVMEPKLTQVTVITRASTASVYIDGALVGMANEPIDVPPGKHEVELRAPGYRNIAITFDIDPAQRRTLHLAMLQKVEDPWERRERGIRKHRLYVQGEYGLLFQSAGFSETSGTLDGGTYKPISFDGEDEASLMYNGAQFSVGYTDEHFGLTLLKFGVMGASQDGEIILRDEEQSRRETATGDGVLRLSVAPLQGTARALFGPFVVHGSTGFGVGLDMLDTKVVNESVGLTETNFFWGASISGRYYWAEEWFGSLGYQLEVDFSDDRGIRHGLIAGVGFNLPVLLADDGSDEGGKDAAPEQIEDEERAAPPAAEVPAEGAPFAPPAAETPADASAPAEGAGQGGE